MVTKQDLETKTIFQQLRDGGVKEVIARRASCAAITISNLECAGLEFVFDDIKKNSDHRITDFQLLDAIRLLERYGFVRFIRGEYELTEEGRASYRD